VPLGQILLRQLCTVAEDCLIEQLARRCGAHASCAPESPPGTIGDRSRTCPRHETCPRHFSRSRGIPPAASARSPTAGVMRRCLTPPAGSWRASSSPYAPRKEGRAAGRCSPQASPSRLPCSRRYRSAGNQCDRISGSSCRHAPRPCRSQAARRRIMTAAAHTGHIGLNIPLKTHPSPVGRNRPPRGTLNTPHRTDRSDQKLPAEPSY